jgi:hypothetical protein
LEGVFVGHLAVNIIKTKGAFFRKNFYFAIPLSSVSKAAFANAKLVNFEDRSTAFFQQLIFQNL